LDKQYTQLLPFNPNERVIDQFGWNPLSIVRPEKSSKSDWSKAYLNTIELRRSEETKYLPGLKFSEFHAGLAENVIHYWSMKGATVVDPFAGRLTRAFVTSSLGRNYIGYDVVKRTVDESMEVLNREKLDATIHWSDGCMMDMTPNESADLVFTCPPYHQLERYEPAHKQLSEISDYNMFLKQIEVCGLNIERVLKPGGFCVWVCGDWRDKGVYRSFHADTIRLFSKYLTHHDTIIMENQSPFAALQLGKVASKRYTSKIHEFILVFKKKGVLEPTSDIIRDASTLEEFYG